MRCAVILALALFGLNIYVAIAAFQLNAFASRWSPVLSMPTEGMTIKMVDR